MTLLILGLLIFFVTHSVRIVADPWRSAMVARVGVVAWRGAHALLSLLGLALIIWGFGQARQQPVVLWVPPVALRHVAALLTVLAFVLAAAACVPGNALRARLGHPLLPGIKLWAFAHLLANGTVADVLLFGSFLAWSVLAFAAARRRDRAAGVVRSSGGAVPTVVTVVLGLAAWAGFAFWAHAAWIGVRPFGG